MNHHPILPGAVIGVLGGGQLGRMFAIAARRMGYRVHVLSPDYDTPAGQVADVEITTPYEELDEVARFARNVEVVTFEFENVPLTTAEQAARFAPVRPSGRVLHTTQNRLREKSFLASAGFPVTPFRVVRTVAELELALGELGMAAVLKTAEWGYDGKGQIMIAARGDTAAAWRTLDVQEAIVEQFVEFVTEISVVGARGLDGNVQLFDPIENRHSHHILDVSFSPAAVTEQVAREAVEIARSVLEELDVLGVMCVEFFVTADNHLLINELAPRPHNSGHLTIDAHASCQFEQQVRAVCGLPLGSPEQLRPVAMANLLGDLWTTGTPVWANAFRDPRVKLHLYGKSAPRVGRKMGHLTALASSSEEAMDRVLAARQAILRDKGCDRAVRKQPHYSSPTAKDRR